MKITEENLIALSNSFDLLRQHPCSSCSNDLENCDVCYDARKWLEDVCPFIFSPLLEYVIGEFAENHSLYGRN